MTKDFIKSFFSMDNNEFLKLIENASKIVKKLEEELDETKVNDNTESYYHSSEKEYNNGKLVKKSEKEYVNGECTKDDEFDCTKRLEDSSNTENGDCKCSHKIHLYHQMKEENEALKKQVNDMAQYIDALNDTIKELNTENNELSKIVNNVKKCF